MWGARLQEPMRDESSETCSCCQTSQVLLQVPDLVSSLSTLTFVLNQVVDNTLNIVVWTSFRHVMWPWGSICPRQTLCQQTMSACDLMTWRLQPKVPTSIWKIIMSLVRAHFALGCTQTARMPTNCLKTVQMLTAHQKYIHSWWRDIY